MILRAGVVFPSFYNDRINYLEDLIVFFQSIFEKFDVVGIPINSQTNYNKLKDIIQKLDIIILPARYGQSNFDITQVCLDIAINKGNIWILGFCGGFFDVESYFRKRNHKNYFDFIKSNDKYFNIFSNCDDFSKKYVVEFLLKSVIYGYQYDPKISSILNFHTFEVKEFFENAKKYISDLGDRSLEKNIDHSDYHSINIIDNKSMLYEILLSNNLEKVFSGHNTTKLKSNFGYPLKVTAICPHDEAVEAFEAQLDNNVKILCTLFHPEFYCANNYIYRYSNLSDNKVLFNSFWNNLICIVSKEKEANNE